MKLTKKTCCNFQKSKFRDFQQIKISIFPKNQNLEISKKNKIPRFPKNLNHDSQISQNLEISKKKSRDFQKIKFSSFPKKNLNFQKN